MHTLKTFLYEPVSKLPNDFEKVHIALYNAS